MSARILFYVLQQQSSERDALTFACHLIEKITQQSLRVSVMANDEMQCQAFDEALWAFKAQSFISHTRFDTPCPHPAQVILHQKTDPPAPLDVWLAMAETEAFGLLSFSRIIHIVRNDDAVKTKARSQFKYYRELGFSPETIPL